MARNIIAKEECRVYQSLSARTGKDKNKKIKRRKEKKKNVKKKKRKKKKRKKEKIKRKLWEKWNGKRYRRIKKNANRPNWIDRTQKSKPKKWQIKKKNEMRTKIKDGIIFWNITLVLPILNYRVIKWEL